MATCKHKNLCLKIFAVLFATLLTSGAEEVGTGLSGPRVSPSDIDARRGTLVRLARTLKPSVVYIKVTKRERLPDIIRVPDDPFFRRFFEDFSEVPKEREVAGQGSGFLISSDGYIVTNNHVVGGATEIEVTLLDGRSFEGELIGADAKTDIALIKIEPQGTLPSVKLGDSDRAEVGEWVMAIGNPFGLEATVTVGVLSGKERVIGAGPYDDFLQTDASINPGNSGGPLFNLSGEVIGVNTAIIASGQGIGFAVPINLAQGVVEQLRADGHVHRGYVGLGIQNLSPELAQALGLPEQSKGALVGQVVAGGPADLAGVKEGDLVVEFDGQTIDSNRALLKSVADTPVGKTAKMKVIRQGREILLEVKVRARPDEDPSLSKEDGPLDAALEVGCDFQDREGKVVITRVVPNSPASKAGLKPGDVILKVGTKRVSNAKELTQRRWSGKTALLIERGENTFYLVVEIAD